MSYFIIGYGLNGGFGGIHDYEVCKAEDKEEALDIAWELACEEYESYFMSTGDPTIEEIMEEDGVDSDTALDIYIDNREVWLDYSAEPFSKELEEEIESKHHYTNHYKEQTNDI